MKIGDRNYGRRELERYIGSIAQLGGTRHYQLTEGNAKGTAAIDFNTGSGLCFTVLPDRGLDIPAASYQGVNLVYHTPNGEANPAFYNPQGSAWLRTFFGGLLTTCGLTYLGPPGNDGGGGTWASRPLQYNYFGCKKSPFTILYHINCGFPLLDETSELVLTAVAREPYDSASKAGLASFNRFTEPMRGFTEQNFFHTMAGDAHGFCHAAIINRGLAGGLGLYIKFERDSLPYLSEWKMMGEGDYAVGIEPSNTKCMNRSDLRKQGLLPFLEPCETREIRLEIGVLSGDAEIRACIERTKAWVGGSR